MRPAQAVAPIPERAAEYARLHRLVDVRAFADALADRVAAAVSRGELPIILGGDHTVALGGFAGVRRGLADDSRLALVWIDAHPDLNTPESSPSHHAHGMPLAALLGRGHALLVEAGGGRAASLDPQVVAIVGARSIDPGEADFLAQHPELTVFPAQAFRAGLDAPLSALVAWSDAWDALYLSFDLDAVDPSEAPGVTTPASGGISRDQAVEIARRLAQTGKLVGVDVVEHLPARDPDGRTARLAADLVLATTGEHRADVAASRHRPRDVRRRLPGGKQRSWMPPTPGPSRQREGDDTSSGGKHVGA